MNYYNEHDPKAAAWLRELIKAGLISNGIVDDRDIQKIHPDELSEYTQCHFFAGIGGWSYALRLAGWPDDEPVWTGSCPCQPFSVAGAGKGIADERHLWPDFKRLIEACKPPIVFGEQVASSAVIGSQKTSRQGLREALSPKKSGEGFDSSCKIQGIEKENSIHSRSACSGDSGQDRQWFLRGVRSSFPIGWWQDLEQPLFGQEGFKAGLHTGKHPGGLPCSEQRLGRLGRAEVDGNSASDYLEAQECVQRFLAQAWGEIKGEAEKTWLDGIRIELERMHYSVGACVLPAACVGAPHIRQRLYWVANANGARCSWARPAQPEKRNGDSVAAGSSPTRGLADDAGERRNGGAGVRGTNGRAIAETSGGLGNADDAGSQGQRRLIELNDAERRQIAERYNPASGFWGGYNLLQCTDGETRRIESATLKMVDGIPSIMGIDRAQGYGKLEEEIIQYAKTKNERPGEALSILWRALIEETIQRHFGGQIGFSSPPVLLSFLRELTNERWQFSESILRSSQETKEAIMRSLWWEKASPRSPHKRGLEEQHTGKPPNALCVLSSILARHIQTHWGEAVQAYADAGFPLAHGIKGRVGLLRGYGNAIVPQIAAEFISAFKECFNP